MPPRAKALLSIAVLIAGSQRVGAETGRLRSPASVKLVGAGVGANDFRISDLGGTGDPAYDATSADIAYNSTNDEYLVVWTGRDGDPALATSESEVWGQRLRGSNGAEIGVNDFRISDAGPEGDVTYGTLDAAVAYNPTANEYLVVWVGDDDVGTLADNELEVWGQRIDAATGVEVGVNDFRISSVGRDGDADRDALGPDVVYNHVADEYLVVWRGDDVVDDDYEVFGQRLAGATGNEVGADDFRISSLDATSGASSPAVAFNGLANEYLVVWTASELLPDEIVTEVHAQRLSGATGAEVGEDDFRISEVDPPDDVPAFAPTETAVAFNAIDNEYLAVWASSKEIGAIGPREREIWGQRLEGATGMEVGVDDFRISDMGKFDGNAIFEARDPRVAHNPVVDEYLVVWRGNDNEGNLTMVEYEVFGQRVDGATGTPMDLNDFRISDMGFPGAQLEDAEEPAVAYNPAKGEYLVVWYGDDNRFGLVADELEVFGQRINQPLFYDGFESGDLSGWDAVDR